MGCVYVGGGCVLVSGGWYYLVYRVHVICVLRLRIENGQGEESRIHVINSDTLTNDVDS